MNGLSKINDLIITLPYIFTAPLLLLLLPPYLPGVKSISTEAFLPLLTLQGFPVSASLQGTILISFMHGGNPSVDKNKTKISICR